jgi:glycosyltransferase involved in cell wall biosynthesis
VAGEAERLSVSDAPLPSDTVSIVIPTYNRADKLERAIRSALQQTYEKLEVIVMDDASPDATPNTVESFEDSRLRYIRHDQNLGPNENWRSGIQEVRGDFFCILPDDDALAPTFVEKLMDALQQDQEMILAFSDHWVMNKEGQTLHDVSARNSREYGRDGLSGGRVDDFARTALIEDSIYIGAVLFRREFVPASFLDPTAESAMGGWILYNCVRTGRPAAYVPERLTYCRWHEGSVSRSQEWLGSITQGNIRRYRRMLNDERMHRFRAKVQDNLATMLHIKGNMHLRRGSPVRARESLRESLSYRFHPSVLLAYGLALLGPAGSAVARFLHRHLD